MRPVSSITAEFFFAGSHLETKISMPIHPVKVWEKFVGDFYSTLKRTISVLVYRKPTPIDKYLHYSHSTKNEVLH